MSERVVWVVESRKKGTEVWASANECFDSRIVANGVARDYELGSPNYEYRAWPCAAKESAQ